MGKIKMLIKKISDTALINLEHCWQNQTMSSTVDNLKLNYNQTRESKIIFYDENQSNDESKKMDSDTHADSLYWKFVFVFVNSITASLTRIFETAKIISDTFSLLW